MHKNTKDLSLLALLAGSTLLLYFIFAPFLVVLSLAAVFACLLHHPFERLARALRNARTVAATIMIALTVLLFILPLLSVGLQVLHEAQTLYADVHMSGVDYLAIIDRAISQPIQQIFPGFEFDTRTYIGNVLTFIANNLASLTYQTFAVTLDIFLMLLALFFFLRDGRDFVSAFESISPLGSESTREIFNKMDVTIRSVVRGTFVNALIRWLCIWAAFYVFGIPNATLWSSLGGIIGAIPGLGTPFAFVGAVVYLYVSGNIIGAVALTAIGIAIVVVVDNILTSYFFGKGLEASPLFVLFSILGGIALFGPVGFILGPLALSVFLSVVRVRRLHEAG